MGLKDLFSSKRLIDRINKYFQDGGITLAKEGDNKYSFELFLSESGYSLYPYFIIDENESELSIIINVRQAEDGIDLERINRFNLSSKYFKAMVNENSLFLEYNTLVSMDNLKEIFTKTIESIFSLQEDIDKL